MSPGVQGNPYLPKTKNSPDLAHYFWEGPKSRFTYKSQQNNKHERHRQSKFGGRRSQASKLRASCPPLPPPPRFPRPCFSPSEAPTLPRYVPLGHNRDLRPRPRGRPTSNRCSEKNTPYATIYAIAHETKRTFSIDQQRDQILHPDPGVSTGSGSIAYLNLENEISEFNSRLHLTTAVSTVNVCTYQTT